MKDDVNPSTLQINGPLNVVVQRLAENNHINEPSLGQLFSKIRSKYKLILTVTSLSFLFAAFIVYMMPGQYRTQTILSVPGNAQLKALFWNADSSLTNNEIFHTFTKKLSQRGNIVSFLEDSKLLDEALKNAKKPISSETKTNILNQLALNYQTTFIHHRVDDLRDNFKDNSKEAILTTLSPQLDLGAKNNKAYIAYTNEQVLKEIAREQRAATEQRIKLLERQIQIALSEEALKRSLMLKRLENKQALKLAQINTQIDALKQRDVRDRQLQIQELNKALTLASSLGITTPKTSDLADDQNLINRDDLYLLGTIYLKNALTLAQKSAHTGSYGKKLSIIQEKMQLIKNDQHIYALKNRTDDKPYVKNIIGKQIEIKRLKALSFDLSSVKAYHIDGTPFVETTPIKPKKRLILVLGIVFGILLSGLILLVEPFIRSRRNQIQASA